MSKYGYTCSGADVHKEVEIKFRFAGMIIRDTSCSTNGKIAFSRIIDQLNTVHSYEMNRLGRTAAVR